ncbi:MAG: LiaI-LiaF-like domain-containing protein [Desulfopila sp.]
MRKSTGPLLLIVLGILLLLSNLGILPTGEIKALLKQWWPLLLIIIGIIQLLGSR